MAEFISVFIIGLVFGSFLNVVIYRLNPALQLKGGVFGRSMCPKCKTQLKWHELIPVFSFFWLGGRCRYCGKKISWQYPAVEILSGFVWVSVFYQNFNNYQLLITNYQLLNTFYQIFILSTLLVIAVYDAKWKIIPDKIVYPAIVIVLIYNLFDIFKSGNLEIFIKLILTASAAFLFFFLIYFFSKGRAMGFGDAKLGFLIGLFLGPVSATAAFTLAFIIGAIFGIMLVGLGKKTLKSQIALGPFLVLGVFIAFFFSNFILKIFQP
ncbi:MAG: prepilin peptidase [bacterium]|nr:prepilin peptidase [bacterium]